MCVEILVIRSEPWGSPWDSETQQALRLLQSSAPWRAKLKRWLSDVIEDEKRWKKTQKKGKGFERIRKDWKWREMIGNLLWKASLLQGLPNLIRHFLCHWGLSRSFLAPLSRAPRPHPGSVAASARLDDAAAWRSLQGVWPLRCPVQKASKTIF